MPTLVFSKEFLDDFVKLEPPVRQKVRELPGKFEDATHSGVHLEKLTGAKDDRIRTVRVDRFWRGVVVRLGEGRYALLRVLPHDDANRWAVRQKMTVNPVTGLVEIVDVQAVEDRVEALTQQASPESPSLFDGVRDRDLKRVGIEDELIPLIRKLTDEAELDALANRLPPAQADALLMSAAGMEPDEVWSELVKDYEITVTEVDTEDIETALEQPGSKASFIVTTSDAELVELLSGDFEAWRTFLHPTQRSTAYRPVYNGPAKVTGGAGTGKTVVAVHRAKFLAERLVESGDASGKILFATFTKNLAQNLEQALRGFCSPEAYRRIQVSTVDALARQVLAARGVRVQPATGDELDEIAEQAATMAGLDEYGLDHRFLRAEWEQVVLGRRIGNLVEYAVSPRPGRGVRLPRKVRRVVWAAIEYLADEVDRRGKASFLQIADHAADLLARQTPKPFTHVIVDEAQDLHPAQWRLLRAAVSPGPNDLFIVGDAHQRIYDYHVSLSSLGIETRGRSRRLKINYRTSQQILSWALAILAGEEIDDLDGGIEKQIGYRSAIDGPEPRVFRFDTAAEEAEFIVAQVEEWLEEGVAPSALAVIARSRRLLQPIREHLNAAGIEWRDMSSGAGGGLVYTGTMHASKGLEFARLIVAGVNHDAVPNPLAVTPPKVDPVQHALDLQRERCLLYVACTRARDELVVTFSGQPSELLPARWYGGQ